MKKYLLLIMLPLCISCRNGTDTPAYKYTEKETVAFLGEIVRNIKITIRDITEINREPTNELLIASAYPLSPAKIAAYERGGSIKNGNDDISDFATYTFKNYELINERQEKLQLVDNGRAVYLQEFGLATCHGALCQNVGIGLKLNKPYEKLSGQITIEFEMPGNIRRETTIPVNISIHDTLTD